MARSAYAAVFLGMLLALPARGVELVAHRGVHQTFHREGLDDETCTATRIHPPQHPYLENTLESIEAAFAYGADLVEIDVHATSDGDMVVFHDWTLDCRTDGTGVTREQPLAYLKGLDIGYGYTADGGQTFPFRGQGVGRMPTLREALAAFPERRLVINQKDRSLRTARILADILNERPARQRGGLVYWGAPETHAQLRARVPELGRSFFYRPALRTCLVRYLLYGWTGIFPDACRERSVVVPAQYAPWLWGWQERFVERARRHGSTVGVWFMEGSSPEEFARAMQSELDYVMVETIEELGPLREVRDASGSTPQR